MTNPDPLTSFAPPVAAWFRETFGEPTPPQAAGWPAIQRGENTLILAPTGSGKTLAAFLWGIDQIYRDLVRRDRQRAGNEPGVKLLYVSPLKALNNDIERNLRAPLEGIRATAIRMGEDWPQLRVAVRTGDTPGHRRAQMVKHPPHILITTPESLYLILTSARARDMLRSVRTVIVDEIHTLCSNKRGVHLSLSLERLAYLGSPGGRPQQRIGLSATQRPLEEVARFLGGQDWVEEADDARELKPRPVAIVDAGYRKPLDLQVVTTVEDFGDLPGNTIWPAVIARLLGEVRRHRTTLVFTNNRRLAERTADRLNAQLAAEETEEIPPGSTEALAPGGVVRDRGIFGLGANGPIRAHHGSMSKDARRGMEEDLKAGRLPALVGTSSLELGIDIGTIDLVVQLQSPKSVAQGLQRVGRSGHLVGQTSIGRIYATFREDLVEAAAIARGMLDGAIEETFTPRNPLDVLAQQVVAAVAVEDWDVSSLYHMVRRSYAYQNLSRRAFDSVLEMLSGKYYQAARDTLPVVDDGRSEDASRHQAALPSLTALRARISWDRTNGRLAALPGSRLLAVSNAGTIPDTGAYGIYLADGKTRVGDLDEEFVFETRPGDAFLFGSQVWRVLEIQNDRLVVNPAPGAVPRVPFWNGDYPWRPFELGLRIGRFRREVAERLEKSRSDASSGSEAAGDTDGSVEDWLQREYVLDGNSARNLVAYMRSQLDAIGGMSSDRTIIAEFFRDAVGEPRLVVHSPYGGRVNGAWAMALRSALRDRGGSEPELMANDDGIIFRFPELSGPPPVDLILGMTPAEARERILRELPNSALFGAQFRMAAGRALLLPRAHGRRRTPFWLQRLKAKDLLAVVRRFGDFPLLVETYRACLQDVLDLEHLQDILAGIQSGAIRVVPIETAVPSPVAGGLLFYFMNQYLYEWDVPKAERDLQALTLRREVLTDILAERADLSDLLRPEAIADVVAEIQHQAPGYQARSAEELAVYLQELGDRAGQEISAMCTASPTNEQAGEAEASAPVMRNPRAEMWLAQLAEAGRAVELAVPTSGGPQPRWVAAELAGTYREGLTAALPAGGQAPGSGSRAALEVLRRYLQYAGPVTREAILRRYPFPAKWLEQQLAEMVAGGMLARGRYNVRRAGDETEEYCDVGILEQIQRRTLSQLRREVNPVSLPTFVAFLTRWQHLTPAAGLSGQQGLREVMSQLRGMALPADLWNEAVLPARLHGYHPAELAALCSSGELVWSGTGSDVRHLRVRFFYRGEGSLFLSGAETTGLSSDARAVHDYLKSEGASFFVDLQSGAGLSRPAMIAALAELIIAGLVTNDNLAALWAIVAASRTTPGQSAAAASAAAGAADRRIRSSLESDLTQRMAGKPRPLTHTRYNEARRRAARHVGLSAPLRSAGFGSAPVPVASMSSGELSAGRWSLVHRAGVLGPILSPDDRAARQAQVLLRRYGVLTRDLLAHEDVPSDWGLIYAYLQRLEMRGEVRRGYFVAGFSGAQFALPEAVEALRAAGNATTEDLVVINATDPANIYGGELAGPEPGDQRFARVPSTDAVLWHGTPALIAEDHGARLSMPEGVPREIMVRAIQAYLSRPPAPRHLVVTRWNGAPVWGSSGEAILQSLGFYRSPAGMEWWAT